MGSHPVVLKDLETEQRIPGGIALGKGMRLARQGIEPIPQTAIEPLDMHCPSANEVGSPHAADFDRDEVPMLIAVFDGLGQLHAIGYLQTGASPLPGPLRLAILVGEHLGIALPAIAAPSQRLLVRMRCRLLHGLGYQWGANASADGSDDEATLPLLDESAPPLPSVRFVGACVFFRTKDQNSSISTVVRDRSRSNVALRCSAWSAARYNHVRIVSYLCPVTSSAPRKLPRRITISKAWAISATGVCNRYIGVPSVSPK